jgi:putative intracellular protease/amidase/YHS domain-containing protein
MSRPGAWEIRRAAKGVEMEGKAMRRRELLERSTAFAFLAASPASALGVLPARSAKPAPLTPPAEGSIPVAFLVSEGAVVIDFCGPWEVFQDVSVPGREGEAFRLYTVAETTTPIRTSGGMKIVPDYTFETAPPPKVIVIPAQRGHSDATLDWIRKSTRRTDVTMSVCTGAFLLARTGVLSGKAATTHHSGYRSLAADFPDIQVKRGARFVEDGNLATAGGLSSGIDLALRVVERYYGHEVAKSTAYEMEYQGQGWMNPDSNEIYASARASTEAHPICPLCDMDVDPSRAPSSTYKGKTYYFCSADHKAQFDAAPDKFTDATSPR